MGMIADKLKANMEELRQADQRMLSDLEELIEKVRRLNTEMEAWMQETE
jgi:hypothetical protein